EIYARGVFINRCYDELNLSAQELVRGVHRDYLKAGSELIETNTYGANRVKLGPHGLEARLREILHAGVALAREEAAGQAYVAGSIGPLGEGAKKGGLHEEDQHAAYAEVATELAEAGCDLLFLDTFTSVHDLQRAIVACRKATDLPVVASFSFHRGFIMGHTDFMVAPEDVAAVATRAGAHVVGANCGDGPHTTLDVVEALHAATRLPIAAMPNVGGPALIEGRHVYLSSPEYLAEYGRRFVQKHARLVGGCCGVTPGQIREISSFLLSIQPRSVRAAAAGAAGAAGGVAAVPAEARAEPAAMTPLALEHRSAWGAKIGKQFAVSVELDPPPGLDASRTVESARFLQDHGIDAVNIADGPRAIARMSPSALAVLVKQATGMETIIHYCCRDRNVLAMQMDLIGANALGLHNLMLITGDPPKMGNFPDATPVFDVNSIGLIGFAAQLNRGLDLAGKALGQQTAFVIGTGCHPGAMNLEQEAAKHSAKIAAGAEFVFSQPVYDPVLLERFLAATEDAPPVPFFVGILPLASLKNAEFLTREVPGMAVPEPVMQRLAACKSRDEQREVGIRVASEALEAALASPRVKGAYIFPPFGRYEAILRVLKESGART
ncbi:MAG TPA: bifunctional homocysteine S-methyltransferase/methylenetetrahydrofolate reductase, partial [Planctomycetota bacterium]|nr:bifunctional homocysteine S-methyltransferase/methylenetetrahydrofolate reductase [Planctomycetota bacterium]